MGKYVQQQPKFEVYVLGHSTSLEDWRRSLQAPAKGLPKLTPEEKAFAWKFKIAEEDYARSRLSQKYGQERMMTRGASFGVAVEEILAGLGPGYQLKAVIAEMMKERWVVRIQTPRQVVNVAVDRELADDIVDSHTVQDQERLRSLLVSSLERSEYIGRRQQS